MVAACGFSGAVGSVILVGIISAAAPDERASDGLPLARSVFFNAQGTLVIYDAAAGDSSPSRLGEQASAYLAYWHDHGTKQLYFYDQLLINQKQLHDAIASLEQTFAPGLADVDRYPPLRRGREGGQVRDIVPRKISRDQAVPAQQPMWREATAEGLYALMRLPGESPGFGPVIVVAADACPPPGCLELTSPDMLGADGMSAPPGPGSDPSFEDFVSGALMAADCCGGGDGDDPPPQCNPCCCCCVLEATTKLADMDGQVIAASACCPPPNFLCSDWNACTVNDKCGNSQVEYCDCGECCGVPKNCDDGNPCTYDGCQPSSGLCVHTNRHGSSCPDDENLCTNDVCQGATCTHPPLCQTGGPCCQEGDLVTCCAAGKKCCYSPLHCCDQALECCGSGCCDPATSPAATVRVLLKERAVFLIQGTARS